MRKEVGKMSIKDELNKKKNAPSQMVNAFEEEIDKNVSIALDEFKEFVNTPKKKSSKRSKIYYLSDEVMQFLADMSEKSGHSESAILDKLVLSVIKQYKQK